MLKALLEFMLISGILVGSDPSVEQEFLKAAQKGNLTRFFAILPEISDINVVDDKGRTILHLAVKYLDESYLEHFIYLNGLVLDAQDHKGRTAIHIAAQQGKYCTFSTLARRGADIWISDKQGLTPLHYAIKAKRPLVVDEIYKLVEESAQLPKPKL